MRVALIGTEIPDHCIEFAEMMADYCDVLLCIREDFSTKDRQRQKPNLAIEWLPWPRKRDLRNIIFLQKLSRLIRQWKPDVVHFLSESNVWNWILVLLLKPTPIVTTVHDVKYHIGDFTSTRVPRVFAHALIRKSDAIIVHGQRLRGEASKLLPISSDRIFVAPLISLQSPSTGATETALQNNNMDLNDELFRMLFFGRIREYKGLRYLLEAMPLLRASVPNLRLIIAGEGDISQYSDYLDHLSNIEIRNRFIPRSEVDQLFEESDLLVLPYIEGSQSGPLTIAMAFGVPVVASDVGDISSVVQSAEIGLVVPPRNVAALAHAVTKIALDKSLRKHFVANAKKANRGEYSKKNVGSMVLRIYQHVIDMSTRTVG